MTLDPVSRLPVARLVMSTFVIAAPLVMACVTGDEPAPAADGFSRDPYTGTSIDSLAPGQRVRIDLTTPLAHADFDNRDEKLAFERIDLVVGDQTTSLADWAAAQERSTLATYVDFATRFRVSNFPPHGLVLEGPVTDDAVTDIEPELVSKALPDACYGPGASQAWTDTRCIGFLLPVLWCQDKCRVPGGVDDWCEDDGHAVQYCKEESGSWYGCGVCFGFEW